MGMRHLGTMFMFAFFLVLAWCSALQVGASPQQAVAHADVRLEAPLPGDTVTSPLIVRGSARGTWFFEASFSVRLVTVDGRELASGAATALSNWMTTDFVPFEVTMDYAVPATTDALLILEKANPSGLLENAGSLTLPVVVSATEK